MSYSRTSLLWHVRARHRKRYTCLPPAATITCPAIQGAGSLARNVTARAMSSGVDPAKRCSGPSGPGGHDGYYRRSCILPASLALRANRKNPLAEASCSSSVISRRAALAFPDLNSSCAAANREANSRSGKEWFLAPSLAISMIFSDGPISRASAKLPARAVRIFMVMESQIPSGPALASSRYLRAF